MRYVLLVYSEEARLAQMSQQDLGAMFGTYKALKSELAETGCKQTGEALESMEKATCVRLRNGKRLVTDGPFAETKEQLGGFYLLECKDLDEAIAWAAKIPSVNDGTIEIRPVWEFAAEQG